MDLWGGFSRGAPLAAGSFDAPVDARLEPFLHELAEAPLTPSLRSVIDASDEASRRRGRDEALALLMQRELSRAPMLLLVEDLHWAPASLVDALLRLTPVTVDQPLVLVLTSRPENERLYDSLRSQPARAPKRCRAVRKTKTTPAQPKTLLTAWRSTYASNGRRCCTATDSTSTNAP